MNILIDVVPTELEINGKMYEINSDFRTSILFELLMQDEELPDDIKFAQALKLYFPKLPPVDDLEETIDKIIWFYGAGRDEKEAIVEGECSSDKDNDIYSFEYDDEYIYSAFLDQYGVDLQDIEYLHWWKFKAMFKSLKEDNKICEIMKYRGINLKEIESKEERSFYKKMKDKYKLPKKIDKKALEEKNMIEEMLMGDGDLEELNL